MTAERFNGGEEGPLAGLPAVRERLGTDSEEYRSYVRLLKATHSYVLVAEAYYMAPEGSAEEMAGAQALSRMSEGLRQNPDKAASLAETMAALVVHLKHGGTYEEWFDGLEDEP